MSLPRDAAPMAFILTRDMARAVAFYRDVLGLAVLGEDRFATIFDVGAGVPMRLSLVETHEASPHTLFGWRVADLDASMAALRAKGVSFLIYDGMGQDEAGVWTAPGGGARVAWFADPDGNGLSVTGV